MSEYRVYCNLITARKWINNHGLGTEVVRYDKAGGQRIMPVILCDTAAQAREIRERGFKTEVKCDSLRVGATVRLNDDVLKAMHNELAVVERFLKDNTVHLDRAIGGTSWWHANDLFVITPGAHG